MRLGGGFALVSLTAKFQSHAGSIEAVVFAVITDRDPQFQSHAGSIEASNKYEFHTPSRGFQSHAGSIEAGLEQGGGN